MNNAKELIKVNGELKMLTKGYKSKLKLVNSKLNSLTVLKFKEQKN